MGLSSSCPAQFLHPPNGKGAEPLHLADQSTLVGIIAKQYEAIHDFNATVDMAPAMGSAEKNKITEYKDVRAFILFRQPGDIRMIGLYPVVRNKAFDMVSAGPDFKLYIAAKNRFLIGPNGVDPAFATSWKTSARSTFWRRCWCGRSMAVGTRSCWKTSPTRTTRFIFCT